MKAGCTTARRYHTMIAAGDIDADRNHPVVATINMVYAAGTTRNRPMVATRDMVSKRTYPSTPLHKFPRSSQHAPRMPLDATRNLEEPLTGLSRPAPVWAALYC